MIHDIRHAFNDLLHENMWMDKETRLVAEDKANNMRERIGYPEYITNTTRLITEYKNVSHKESWTPTSTTARLNRFTFYEQLNDFKLNWPKILISTYENL